MKDFVKWSDFLDEEKILTEGEFNLYRNYRTPEGHYLYSTFHDAMERGHKYLFDERPIAQGITAYFAHDCMNWKCLYRLLENKIQFRRDVLFSRYFEFVWSFYKRENEKSAWPKDEYDLLTTFIRDHHHQEDEKLKNSQKYYLKRSSKEDSIKTDIHEYCIAYMDWIEQKEIQIKNMKSGIDINDDKEHKINLLIERLATTFYYKNKTLIPRELKNDFIPLLLGTHVDEKIKWHEADWMLYVLIEYFIKNGFLKIDKKYIPEYMIKEFAFKSERTRKKIRDNRFNTERNSKKESFYSYFTKKIREIYESLQIKLL